MSKRRFERVDWTRVNAHRREFGMVSGLVDLEDVVVNVDVNVLTSRHQEDLARYFASQPVKAGPEVVIAKDIVLLLNFASEGTKYAVIDERKDEVAVEAHNIDDAKDAFGLLRVAVHKILAPTRWMCVHGAWLETDSSRLFVFGGKGAGKSSLCEHLAQKGWQVMADDSFFVDLCFRDIMTFANLHPPFRGSIAAEEAAAGSKPLRVVCLARDGSDEGVVSDVYPNEFFDTVDGAAFLETWDRAASVLPAYEADIHRLNEKALLNALAGWYPTTFVRNADGFDVLERITKET